jgi:hypothetical protein
MTRQYAVALPLAADKDKAGIASAHVVDQGPRAAGIGPIPGLRHLEADPVPHTVKRAGPLL